jgi:hypothetical protein
MVEVGLIESVVAHRVSHFQGLPFFLDFIECRVHREHMNMIMRVGDPIDGPGLAVNKLRVDHVGAKAIVLLIPLANLGSIRASIVAMVSSRASTIICSRTLSSLTARYSDTDLGTLKVKS